MNHLLKMWESNISLSMRSEMLDRTLHAVPLAVRFHGVNLVVVGCSRLEVVHAHAENRMGMARVQPDGRFRGLAEFLGIRTVMHDSVMLGRTPGVVACPPDNHKIGISPFDL